MKFDKHVSGHLKSTLYYGITSLSFIEGDRASDLRASLKCPKLEAMNKVP